MDDDTRAQERIRSNEHLAKIFHDVYRKTFVTPDWELTGFKFRLAISDGIAAVLEEVKKDQDKSA